MYSTSERRPLFDTVKKYATSRAFLTVIVCSFISIGATCLLFGSVYPALLRFGDFFDVLTPHSNPASSVFDVMMLVVPFVFVLEITMSIILIVKLVGIRRFFLGKSCNDGCILGYIKAQKVYYIITAVLTAVPILLSVLVTFGAMLFSGDFETTFALLIFIFPLFVAETGGILVLYYFSFKAIKTTLTYADNALNNKPEGKVSVFSTVLAIINLVAMAVAVLEMVILFFVAIIFYAVMPQINDPFFSVFFSASFAPLVSLITSMWALPFVAIPSLISSICYVKLIFSFKKDMELAKLEHTELERARAEVLASALTADADDTSETVDTDSDSQSTEENGDSV